MQPRRTRHSRRPPLSAVATAAAVVIFLVAVLVTATSADERPPAGAEVAATDSPADKRAERARARRERRAAKRRQARRQAARERAARAKRRRVKARRARARRRAARERRRERERKAIQARMRNPRTVRDALRSARLAGRVERSEYETWVARYSEARRVARRLGGARGAELGSVVRTLEGIAARGRLTAGRMPVLFLQLHRNTQHWRSAAIPEHGDRVRFGDDPVVFQYYRGHGLQFHPLANFGLANKLYNECRAKDKPCRKRSLRKRLDRLVELGARRGDFVAWEYYFSFSSGTPPWISGMAQGTAVQALARGARVLRDRSYLNVARQALGAFEQRTPAGVAVPIGGGTHYAMYSFAPRLNILNGFLQAVAGLQTFARVSGDRRAKRLFARGERLARAQAPSFDTGAWSLYSRPGGSESTLEYHRLVRDFLRNLCRRGATEVYCGLDKRFTAYLGRPPHLHVRPVRGARAGRETRLRMKVSRGARLRVMVRDARGRRQHVTTRSVGRGWIVVGWRPRRSGRHRVEVSVRGAGGNVARSVRVARVRPRR